LVNDPAKIAEIGNDFRHIGFVAPSLFLD